MSKKVLIISTRPRRGGNSQMLANKFAKGAEEEKSAMVVQLRVLRAGLITLKKRALKG